jgi:MYND finger/SET domain
MEQSFCSFCYTPIARLLRCGRCHKRGYCGRDCQRRDWTEASHKYWCGKAGEIGFDFAIQPCGEKGLGMVALRAFEKNDLIMVERPILMVGKYTAVSPGLNLIELPTIDQIEASAQPTALALAPENGTFADKFKTNSIGCYNQEPGLFLTMSRINHDCIGNASHMHSENRRVHTLVASRDISSGEEVTMSYLAFGTESEDGRQQDLYQSYHFICRCRACVDPEVEADLDKMKNLSRELIFMPQREVALRKGESLLKMYDKYGMSGVDDVYFKLFMVAKAAGQVTSAKRYLQLAYEAALAFSHDESSNMAMKIKSFMARENIPYS